MKNYDPIRETKLIMYLDENNSYDWEMSQYLSYCKFKWLKDVYMSDVNSIREKSYISIFLKLKLNISMNYIIYTMVIHQLQKNLQCQIIVKNLLINME